MNDTTQIIVEGDVVVNSVGTKGTVVCIHHNMAWLLDVNGIITIESIYSIYLEILE